MSLSSETMGERRVMKSGEGQSPAPEPENLQCPRCESTNTKFCYYNNYNLSQPRYFCKGCRRYWTRGGSLRNIPVGGGSRKNSKRSRISVTSEPPAVTEAVTPVSFCIKTENINPNPNPNPASAMSPFRCSDMNLNEALPGSFSSLLGSQQQTAGFLGLGGYGLGLGHASASGFDMLGFGFGKSAGDWPAVDIGGENVNGDGSGVTSSGCNTWQIDGGALTDGGDCFGWPDLAISTPGTANLE